MSELRLTIWRSRLLRVSRELPVAAADGHMRLPTSPPAAGWIRHIREALNMSGYQLARRVGVGQPAVARLELHEREGTITLHSLRRVADALNCDVVYALVARAPLNDMVAKQIQRALASAQRKGVVDAGMREDVERQLLVRIPRWIWGSAEYPELYLRSDAASDRPG